MGWEKVKKGVMNDIIKIMWTLDFHEICTEPHHYVKHGNFT